MRGANIPHLDLENCQTPSTLGPTLRAVGALRGQLDGNGMSKRNLDWTLIDDFMVDCHYWLNQSMASRVSGKSRQWIHQKIKSGKLKTKITDGITYVALPDLVLFMVEVESDEIANEFEEYIYGVLRHVQVATIQRRQLLKTVKKFDKKRPYKAGLS